MSLKRSLRDIFAGLTGLSVYRKNGLPHGYNFVSDVKRLVSREIKVVFDVGANVGQTAMMFHAEWPEAKIYSFEPVSETFRALESKTKKFKEISCWNYAVGDEQNASKYIYVAKNSLMSSIYNPKPDAVRQPVEMITIDDFCLKHSVDRIGILKIDTEGGDLLSLKGAEKALLSQRVDLVQVEASMNPENHSHVSFEEVKEYMESLGYRLFGIYDQVWEWPSKCCNLRRANPVFISSSLLAETHL